VRRTERFWNSQWTAVAFAVLLGAILFGTVSLAVYKVNTGFDYPRYDWWHILDLSVGSVVEDEHGEQSVPIEDAEVHFEWRT